MGSSPRCIHYRVRTPGGKMNPRVGDVLVCAGSTVGGTGAWGGTIGWGSLFTASPPVCSELGTMWLHRPCTHMHPHTHSQSRMKAHRHVASEPPVHSWSLRWSQVLRAAHLKVSSLSGPLTEDGRLRSTSGSGDTALRARPAAPPGAELGRQPHRFGPLPQAAVLEVRVVGQRPARAQLDPGQQLHASRKHSRPRGVRAKRFRERCRELPGFPGTSSATPTGLGSSLRGQGMPEGRETRGCSRLTGTAPRTSPCSDKAGRPRLTVVLGLLRTALSWATASPGLGLPARSPCPPAQFQRALTHRTHRTATLAVYT